LIEPVRPSRLLEAMLGPIKGTGESGSLEAANTCTLPPVNSQYVTPNSPSSLRILVAEDHPINQQVLVEQLAVLGYQADCVVNGQQALDLLAEKSYDLVLMDCQMPVLDGYKTAQKLREIEGSERHTFVMALTAHAMPGEREKCLAAGMDDYLSKPVDLDALAAALKKYEVRNLQCENKYGVKSMNSEKKSQLATNYTEAKDWQAVEYQAHRLKGTSANVGVAQMSDLATQLEHQARGFQSEPPGGELSKIERVENLLVSLSSHLALVQEFVETRMFG
jgi:CheY-like chemotaxis protein